MRPLFRRLYQWGCHEIYAAVPNQFRANFYTSKFLSVVVANLNEIDAAVIDYNLGNGPTGIDAANALRKNDPELGIVLLTAFLNPLQLESKMAKLPRGSKYLIKHSVSEIGVLVREIEAAISAKK